MARKKQKTVDLVDEEWAWIEDMAKKFTVARGGERVSRNQIFSWLIELSRDRLEKRLEKLFEDKKGKGVDQ